MSDYKVTDTELISVANAIRTKGGTQAQLEWPSGFVSAIGSIQSGGSSDNIIWSNDKTLAVHIDIKNQRMVWYFIGFKKTSDDVNIPSEIVLSQAGLLYSKAYDSDKTTQIGNIGFYNGKIRSWNTSTSQTIAGTFWGVVYSDGGQGQTNSYSDPPAPSGLNREKNILSGTTVPTSAEGSDGDLYLRLGSVEDLSSFSKRNESSQSVIIHQDEIRFEYIGGSAIGGQAYKQIDLTNIDTIEVTVETSAPSYNNYSTDRFAPILIIENTINPASAFPSNTSIVSANGETYRVSTQGDTETFIADVSNLTGNYYIVFSGAGTTAVWKKLILYPNSNADIINFVYLKVNGSWVELIGQDIDDVNTGDGVG